MSDNNDNNANQAKGHAAMDEIRISSLSRNTKLASIGARAGARLTTYSLATLFMSADAKKDRREQMLADQAQMLADELGQLKGSVMKVGQMLALYGEYFLPPQVVEILRSLQDDSPPLDWRHIQARLQEQLGDERLAKLDINPEPLAAASLGQVHRATIRATGEEVAVKVQYPGVAESIDSDLKSIGKLLVMSKIMPKSLEFDQMMEEVRVMLHREVDYQRERKTTEYFAALVQNDPRFCVPKMYGEFCTDRVLVSSFELGLKVDGPEVAALPQERRNKLGEAALALFLKEFFEWGAVQTDPHFGNYRVRPSEHLDNGGPDQIILFDFGAVRRYPDEFLLPYGELVRGAYWKDKERLLQAADDLKFLDANNPQKAKDNFANVCFLITEPFEEKVTGPGEAFFNAAGEYHWGNSDLPERVTTAGSKAALSFSFQLPPKEFVFLHRKLGGVFVFLAEINAEIIARNTLKPYMGIDSRPAASNGPSSETSS